MPVMFLPSLQGIPSRCKLRFHLPLLSCRLTNSLQVPSHKVGACTRRGSRSPYLLVLLGLLPLRQRQMRAVWTVCSRPLLYWALGNHAGQFVATSKIAKSQGNDEFGTGFCIGP
jgi:hypothetical protein